MEIHSKGDVGLERGETMKYKAVIFDLDGVICSTDRFHYFAWKKIADELGIYFDENINQRLRGVSRAESFQIILEKYDGKLSGEETEHYLEQKNKLYRSYLEEMTEADFQEEVKSTLLELRKRGYKLAIGSSSKNAKHILEHLKAKEYFDAISDGNNIVKTKPDPEVFLKAAEMLGLNPSDCIVMEDAKSGIEAARKGGMDSIAIGDAIPEGLAEHKVESFQEILGLL